MGPWCNRDISARTGVRRLYDLIGVTLHEVNEVLGTISNVGAADPRPDDLFRFTLAGDRTFTTAGDDAYCSIDGGATQLARFNQEAGGDYGDWWSLGGHVYQVQDAFATPGEFADQGVEVTLLDALGWTPAVLTCAADVDGNGTVDFGDLLLVLGA